MIEILEKAAQRIKDFTKSKKRKAGFSFDEDGIVLGQKVTPVERVGVYVPGGKAAYPSSVMMNVIPTDCRSKRNHHGITTGERGQHPSAYSGCSQNCRR